MLPVAVPLRRPEAMMLPRLLPDTKGTREGRGATTRPTPMTTASTAAGEATEADILQPGLAEVEEALALLGEVGTMDAVVDAARVPHLSTPILQLGRKRKVSTSALKTLKMHGPASFLQKPS